MENSAQPHPDLRQRETLPIKEIILCKASDKAILHQQNGFQNYWGLKEFSSNSGYQEKALRLVQMEAYLAPP